MLCDERQAGPLQAAERGRDDLGHRVAVVGGSQLAEPRTVGEARHHLGCDLDRETRLADATGAGQGHQRRVVEDRHDAIDVVVAADERRHLHRAGSRRTRPATQTRGNSAHEARVRRPGTPARSRQVAQRVLTQVDQLDLAVGDQLLRRERHHDLAAVRRRHQPRGPIHRACRSSRPSRTSA